MNTIAASTLLILTIIASVECQSSESTLFIAGLSLHPLEIEASINNSVFNQKYLFFKDCTAEYFGNRFFEIFPNSTEISFDNCSINLESETYEVNSKVLIEKIEFKNCIITQSKPRKGFKDLSNLKQLIFDNTKFEDNQIGPLFFGKNINLNTLNISNCGILDIHPRSLAYLPNLEYLNLNGNSLSNVSQILIKNDKLKQLDFKFNEHLEDVDNFPVSLEYLNLARSRIDPKDFKLKYLYNLKYLNLSSTVDQVDLTKYFISLEVLDFSCNNFTVLNEKFVAGLESLKELYLQYSQIKVVREKGLKGLYNLEILDLSNNLLESLMVHVFDDLGNLRKLFLENNRIVNLGSEHLVNLEKLEFKNINGSLFNGFLMD